MPNSIIPATDLLTSAGSATNTSAVFWARSVKPASGTLQIKAVAPNGVEEPPLSFKVKSDTNADNTFKQLVTGLKPGTTYSYTFRTNTGRTSKPGFVKTAPPPDAITGMRFGFGGCASGRYAPINSVADITAQNLDFFMMLGDAVYEDSYKRNATDPRGAYSSNEVAPPFNPAAPQTTSKTHIAATVKGMYGKYWDMQNPTIGNLAPLYRSQGIVAAYDNHETVDMALETGGAARSVITVFDQYPDRKKASDKRTAFREGGDLNTSVLNQSGAYLNQSPEHKAVINAWFNAMPLQDLGLVKAPEDPRSDGTKCLYSTQQWGKHALFINTDLRSYRDAKITQLNETKITIKDSNPAKQETSVSENDVTGGEIDLAPGASQRTMLGATQLAWLKQQLKDAQANGTTWKFVAFSSPNDITGIPGTDGNFTAGQGWVDAKSWWGGYRYERNDLLKFIADNGIKGVVFLATDDHEARINEVTYVPNVTKPEDLIDGSLHVTVPGAISVVSSPLGAARPDAWAGEKKTKADIVTASTNWNKELAKANYNPIGLTKATPGFVSFRREPIGGHVSNPADPQPIDFWSPDTHNYAVLDVAGSGQLTVSLRGVDATMRNGWPAVGNPSDVREIFSFTMDPLA